MANVVFLIGNGFDLACGLKSRYSDTYDFYIESISSIPAISKFKQTIKKDVSTWADFEMQLVEYAKDLETETDLLACLRDYNAFLNDYLLNQQEAFWDKYEVLIQEHNSVLKEIGRSIAKFYQGLTNNDIRAIRTSLLRDGIIHYGFINFNYTNVFDRFLDFAFKAEYVKDQLEYSYSCSEVIHIHGSLGSDVILGVDNETQLLELPYSITNKARRNIIKPVFLREFDEERFKTAADMLLKSDIVCVFGLSLGDSDYTWRKLIASWLKLETSHHLVFFKHNYMNRKYHSTAVSNKMDDEEDGKEELLSILFDEPLVDNIKKMILDKMHVPVGVRIFDFDLDNALKEIEVFNEKNQELLKKLKSI